MAGTAVRERLLVGARAEGLVVRAAVRAGLLAEVVVGGGVRDRLIVVAAKGKLIMGALAEEETTLGCLRTLTAAEDALTVDCIRLGRTGALPLSTRAGTDF